MRTVRLILSDRMSGGVLALAIGVLLFLQSLAGFAVQTRMATAQFDPFAILCAPTGAGETEGQRYECCSSLCQLVAQPVLALPASAGGVVLGPTAVASVDATVRGKPAAAASAAASRQRRSARAPDLRVMRPAAFRGPSTASTE